MIMPSPMEIAKIAYDAYGHSRDHRSYQGDPMPEWDELPDPIKEAWMEAAGAVIRELLYQSRPKGV